MSEKRNHITLEGYQHLQDRLIELHTKREAAVLEVQTAASDKDFAENSPLEAAREALGLIDGQIEDTNNRLHNAIIITDRKDIRRASLGLTISIRDDANQVATYTLVSPSEANILQNKISSVSPLGQALLLKKVGEEFTVISPSGSWQGVVEEIS